MAELVSDTLTSSEVLAQAQVMALRQLSSTLEAQGRALERMSLKLETVSEALTEIKAEKFDSRLERLEGRVDALMVDKERRSGAANLVEYLAKVGPWIFAAVVGVAAAILNRKP